MDIQTFWISSLRVSRRSLMSNQYLLRAHPRWLSQYHPPRSNKQCFLREHSPRISFPRDQEKSGLNELTNAPKIAPLRTYVHCKRSRRSGLNPSLTTGKGPFLFLYPWPYNCLLIAYTVNPLFSPTSDVPVDRVTNNLTNWAINLGIRVKVRMLRRLRTKTLCLSCQDERFSVLTHRHLGEIVSLSPITESDAFAGSKTCSMAFAVPSVDYSAHGEKRVACR